MAPNDWETGGWSDDEESEKSDDDRSVSSDEDGADSEFSVSSDLDEERDDSEFSVASDLDDGESDDSEFSVSTDVDVGSSDDTDFSVSSNRKSAGEAESDNDFSVPDFGDNDSREDVSREDVSREEEDAGSGFGTSDTPDEPSGGDGIPDFGSSDGTTSEAGDVPAFGESGDATEPSGSAAPTREGTDGSLDTAFATPEDEPVSDVGSPSAPDATVTTTAEGTRTEADAADWFESGDGGDLAPADGPSSTTTVDDDFDDIDENAPKIFSPQGIGIATLLGGPLAAVGLLAYNCRQVGWQDRMKTILGTGLVGSGLAYGLVVAAPSSFLPIAGASIGGAMYYANQLQSELVTRADIPPVNYSDLGAAGAGCLFSMVSMALFCFAGIVVA